MNNAKKSRLSRIEIATVAASAAALAFGLAYAGATPHMLGSIFGLAPGETVRVSITNISNPDLEVATPPNPCVVQLKIFGADGSVVVESEFLKIMPGLSVSRDFKQDVTGATTDKSFSFGDDATGRKQLRVASYLFPPGTGTDATTRTNRGNASCSSEFKFLKLSAEVFDSQTGRTSFIVPTDSVLPAVQ